MIKEVRKALSFNVHSNSEKLDVLVAVLPYLLSSYSHRRSRNFLEAS